MSAVNRLAIDGGRPVRRKRLAYARQRVNDADVQAVIKVLRSDWLTTGPEVAAFEEAFAERVGARYAVSVSSGTAALHAAVFAAGLTQGDEAITSPFSFCATANCLLYQGAQPVFADVEPDTLTLDPRQVLRRLTVRTKAVLPVDYAGHPAALEELLALAQRRGLVVIEDACHALGARYRGKPVGSISHLTVFSFHPVKHITTGEGGMVTTDNADFARRLRLFRNHGIERDPRRQALSGPWSYEMVALGYNYRLADIGCALGHSQLRRLDAVLARRREIAGRYTEAFRSLPGLEPPTVSADPEVVPAWHLYPVRVDLARLRVGRLEIFRALQAEGLAVNVHYQPIHLHPYYRNQGGYRPGDYPVAEAAYERLITLPLFDGMTDRDAQDVIDAVGKVCRYFSRGHAQSDAI